MRWSTSKGNKTIRLMFGLLSKNKEGIFNVGLLEMAIALYPIMAG